MSFLEAQIWKCFRQFGANKNPDEDLAAKCRPIEAKWASQLNLSLIRRRRLASE